MHSKILLATAMSAAFVSAAFATENCITLDVDVVHYDATGEARITTPADPEFRYDEEFEIELHGSLPGSFIIDTISPSGEWNREYPEVYFDGRSTVNLPCGAPGYCETEGDRFVFDDGDQPEAQGDEKKSEIMVIRYFPCKTGDPDRDQTVATITPFLDACTGAPVKRDDVEQEEEQQLAMSQYERIMLSSSRREVCKPPEDDKGRVLLVETIRFNVKR